MFVVCVVGEGGAAWRVWRPAFRYDGGTEQLLHSAGGGVAGAWRPCALSALLPGVERALGKPVRRSDEGVDFGRVGGTFDDADAERDRPFEARFGTTGRLAVTAVLALVAPPTLAPPPRGLFARGLDAQAAPLVAHMPPELAFAVAARLERRARSKLPSTRVLDVCWAVYESVKALSRTALAPRLEAEEPRHAEVGAWHATGYSTDAASPSLAVASAADASAAARILATIVENRRAASVQDGLDAAALVSDRGLRWTSAVALGLLSHMAGKTRVPSVAEWAAQVLDVAADDAADDAYY